MTTINEKLRALAEEIESDREEWASLAETAITAHTANERGARAAAHREDARRLRAILDAPPASPEAPAMRCVRHGHQTCPDCWDAMAAENARLTRALSEARREGGLDAARQFPAGLREGRAVAFAEAAAQIDRGACFVTCRHEACSVRRAEADRLRALASTTRGDAHDPTMHKVIDR